MKVPYSRVPRFRYAQASVIGQTKIFQLPVFLFLLDFGESIYNKGYFIVIYHNHEHFFLKKFQFNFPFKGKLNWDFFKKKCS